jgi:hypothetical protein
MELLDTDPETGLPVVAPPGGVFFGQIDQPKKDKKRPVGLNLGGAPTGGAGIFGGAPAAAPGVMFGAAAVPARAAGGLFGAPAPAPAPAAAGGIFGAPIAPAAFAGFGAAPAAAPAGGGLFPAAPAAHGRRAPKIIVKSLVKGEECVSCALRSVSSSVVPPSCVILCPTAL